MPCRSSSRRSMAWTFTSSPYVRVIRIRSRSSSRTAGRDPSLSNSSSSIHLRIRLRTALAPKTHSTSSSRLFPGRPAETGWDPDRIARAWAELMKRLGYARYVAQGGDWGSPVTSAMARQAAAGLLGIHINLPATVPPEVAAAIGGGPVPAGLSEKERAVLEGLMTNAKKGNSAYFTMMTERPQTVGYGGTDPPAGLAAWILVHPGFAQWAYGDDPEKSPTKEDVLD